MDIRKAFKAGLEKMTSFFRFFGHRLQAELALYGEMKKYEAMKGELRALYEELGRRFAEEATEEAMAPYRELL
ncbi:MAG: hypothetical protein D6778_06405, partial [Nitrospirae bacterium]